MKKLFFFLIVLGLMGLSSCEKTISGNGYVYDKVSQQPIAGATISVYLEHPSPDTFQMETETDNNGAYYAFSNPYSCTGSCPDLVVRIVADGYQLEYVRNPNGDTTFLARKQ